MALNKSNKHTPSSNSGYFCDMTVSTVKQNSFLLPVRIKTTPNNMIGSLSDGKKNHAKMLQPVLIKDLLQSNQKDRQHSKIMSVSTQKRKPTRSFSSYSKSNQEEGEETTLFDRKLVHGNKVRRQLYQTLDCSQRSVLDGKSNVNKVIKSKKKIAENPEDQVVQSNDIKNKNRDSFILPLNTIKNTFLRKSASNFMHTNKRNVRNSTNSANRRTKYHSNFTETKKIKDGAQEKDDSERKQEADIKLDFSSYLSSNKIKNDSSCTMQNKSTMTSPSINRNISEHKNISSFMECEQQLKTINSIRSKSELKQSNTNLSCLGIEKLYIEKTPGICSEKTMIHDQTFQNEEFNFMNMKTLNYSGFMELKLFLEESIQACENQTFSLKQALNAVNNILNNKIENTINGTFNKEFKADEKTSVSNTTVNNYVDLNITNIIDKNPQSVSDINNECTLTTSIYNVECLEKNNYKVEEDLSTVVNSLINNEELNKETKGSTETMNDLARLSTIGEVSYEGDEFNKNAKDVTADKENINDSTKIISPDTSRSLLNKSIEDSFILLENELNVQHNTFSSKSLPVSPRKHPVTPATVKQWDKKIQRPLKEYMDLKMNGTFLVTPDVKRFQSNLESTDTPHSRKSLSRKIFMELCDLYAESPESK